MLDKDLLNKEISLIQDVIKRMASNSFMIKGWSLSINAIILALLKEKVFEMHIIFLLFVFIFPIISFWYLDAYFLRQERLYRKLYTWVIKNRYDGNNELPYDLNANRFSKEVRNLFKTMLSKTLFLFYLIPLLLLLCLIFTSPRDLSRYQGEPDCSSSDKLILL